MVYAKDWMLPKGAAPGPGGGGSVTLTQRELMDCMPGLTQAKAGEYLPHVVKLIKDIGVKTRRGVAAEVSWVVMVPR